MISFLIFPSRRHTSLVAVLAASLLVFASCQTTGPRAELEEPVETLDIIPNVPVQPIMAASLRLDEALRYLGSALGEADSARLKVLSEKEHTPAVAEAIQSVLDPYCLAAVNINPEARVKVMRGPAEADLQQGGWKSFLIKVHNESGTRAPIEWESPNAEPRLHVSTGKPEPKPENLVSPGEAANRYLELSFYESRPLTTALSGIPVEYKVLQVYTDEVGPREAKLGFHVGQGSQDVGYRNAVTVFFDCKPSVKVQLQVKDHDGGPAMASFIIRDNIQRLVDTSEKPAVPNDYRQSKALNEPWARPGLSAQPLVGVYPLPSRRVTTESDYPDFFFHPQVYRTDGEHVYLPSGTYDVTWTRGPEYLAHSRTITVPEGVKEHTESFQLERWISMKEKGFFSADHHVHAGGCSHYESPEAGVRPEAMLRQAQGEDLDVSCVLTWGPCWYHQKTFFEGEVHKLSTPENIMRYDVEVSGFPSSHAGHLCLLRLKEDDYPGTTLIEEWPSWTLPVLQWGKQQGGIVGYSHSGWGLAPESPTEQIPNYVMAKFDGIGANEYIVTATHDAVDFISAGDTPLHMELNIWYHVLNSGFRTAISGETDFPCIFDDRIGMARSYTRLGEKLDFDSFVEKIKEGANYVSDGRAHLYNFKVEGNELGASKNEVHLESPRDVTVTATAAAWLPEVQDDASKKIADGGFMGRPYWHVEKARIPGTRKVAVELIVNGYPVQKQEIVADGREHELKFTQAVHHSSWIALRVTASAHTNPIYTLVGDKPIRASRRSAEWCRAAVDQCWKMKETQIRKEDKAAAIAAYDHARRAYDVAIAESVDDRPPAPRE
jgi:hypothetical protein